MAFVARVLAFILLFSAAAVFQQTYDASRVRLVAAADLPPDAVPDADLVRALDLGLHTAAASFVWLGVRAELPFLPQGPGHFLAGLELVNQLDPRWSTPYAFSVLVLPSVPGFPGRVDAALAAGERGVAVADPDWRISFYTGATYLIERGDRQTAALYFDLAADTPGVPEPVRRYALNYGIRPDRLSETREMWAVIHDTSEDPVVRERAAAHVEHLQILEYLGAAVRQFRERHGVYPDDLEALMRAGIIPEIPRSPFGFDFKIYEEGVVGIAPAE
jgi:hypothetical protein